MIAKLPINYAITFKLVVASQALDNTARVDLPTDQNPHPSLLQSTLYILHMRWIQAFYYC